MKDPVEWIYHWILAMKMNVSVFTLMCFLMDMDRSWSTSLDR